MGAVVDRRAIFGDMLASLFALIVSSVSNEELGLELDKRDPERESGFFGAIVIAAAAADSACNSSVLPDKLLTFEVVI